MKKHALLAYLFIVPLLGSVARTANAIAFTVQPFPTVTTISNQTLLPNSTTIQFRTDGPASVTATFYKVNADSSLTAVDTASMLSTGIGDQNLPWNARWLIGQDPGRHSGNYRFQVVASTAGSSVDTGTLASVIVIDSVDIHSLSVTPGVDNSGNATAPFLITYALAKEARVTMTIADSSGTVVRTLVNNQLKSAESVSSHTIVWDGLTASGSPAPLDVYTLTVDATNTASGDTATQRTRTFALASLAGIASDARTVFEENSYVYPNPIRDGQGIFRIQSLRNNSRLSIKIYTVSGDLVRADHFAGLNSGDVTHYSWNTVNQAGNKVGRGLYLCVIREESPEGALQTVKKVAVIQ